MMKRIIAAALAVIVLAGTWISMDGVPSVAAVESDEHQSELALLKFLQIVQNEPDLSAQVSRSAFVTYVARLLDIGEVGIAEQCFFQDVPKDNWIAYPLAELVKRNIVSSGQDTQFRPEDGITGTEACKMLICALGYRPLAQGRGGYPYGYESVARQLKLWNDSQSFGAVLTYAQLVDVLAQVIETSTYEGVVYGQEYTEFSADGPTLLEIYRGMYLQEGVLQAADGLAIYSEYAGDEGVITVDGKGYLCDLDAGNDLGKWVRICAKKSADSGFDSCQYIAPDEEHNKIVEIAREDFLSFDGTNGRIRYWGNKNNREQSLSLALDAAILRNGAIVSTDVESAFQNVENGWLEAIDFNSDNLFDVILINSYRSLVVNYIDSKNKLIYDKYDSAEPVVLDEARKKIKIFSSVNDLSLKDMKQGDILTVYESEAITRIYVSTTVVKGTIEKILQDDRPHVWISGAEYEFDNTFLNRSGMKIYLGMYAELYTDQFGRIAEVIPGTSEDSWQYAYVIDHLQKQEGFQQVMKLKLYIPYRGVMEYTVDNKVTVDGERFQEPPKAYTALLLGGDLKGKVVRVKENEGILLNIDTPWQGEKEGEPSLFVHRPLSQLKYRRSKFGQNIIVNASSLVLAVPEDDELKDADDYRFSIADLTLAKTDSYYDVESYKLDRNSGFDDVVVVKGLRSYDATDAMAVIRSVNPAFVNERNTEAVICIHGGSDKIYYTAEEVTMAGYAAGDVVKFGFDEVGMIVSAEPVYKRMEPYDASAVKEVNQSPEQFNYNNRVIAGYAYANTDGVLKIFKDLSKPEDIFEVYDLSKTNIAIYDSTARKDQELTMGTYRDIKTYVNTGKPAMVIIRTEQVTVSEVIVFQ